MIVSPENGPSVPDQTFSHTDIEALVDRIVVTPAPEP